MTDQNIKTLNSDQIRVLGCLMEKHLATPNNYPLTPNALVLACNQKSNRFPVMQLEEGKVLSTAQQLSELGMLSVEYGERINKYSHRAPGALGVTREQQAVLAMLMLREPLTVNEIKARTEKMIGFESVEQVQQVVEELALSEPALIVQLPVAAGQREERFTHLLAGEPDLSALPIKETKISGSSQAQKIAELEARIEILEAALDLKHKA